jgi:Bax protein
VRIVLPLILHRNAVVLEQRYRLQQLDNHAIADLTPRDRAWLLRLAKLYRVLDGKSGGDADGAAVTEAMRAELLRRIDVVPVSLALAQSAAESGWGTSRFARRGNALFGQWTWDQAAGIIPSNRDEGRSHAVRAFRRLSNSVRAYVHNLNVSNHYKDFRVARAALRRAGPPNGAWGHALAGYLGAYSEEGPEYIRKVRLIIRANDFGDFEVAALTDLPKARTDTRFKR